MQCNMCQIARILISSPNNFLSAKTDKFWISSTMRYGDDLSLHVPVYGEPLMSQSFCLFQMASASIVGYLHILLPR